MSNTEILRLKRKEAELLQRMDRLRKAMNETKELNTLAFKGKLFKEAQEQLRQVQEKLASLTASEGQD